MMTKKIKWICGALLSLRMLCYPIPIPPAVIIAEEQEKIPWEVQMRGLIVHLEIQLVELRAQTHSELYIKQISLLGGEVGKLQIALNTYNGLGMDKRTQEMRQEMSSKYCQLINEVVELRDKVKPPKAGGARDA